MEIQEFIENVREEMEGAGYHKLVLLQDEVDQEETEFFESTGREEYHKELCKIYKEITARIDALEKRREKERMRRVGKAKDEIAEIVKGNKEKISKQFEEATTRNGIQNAALNAEKVENDIQVEIVTRIYDVENVIGNTKLARAITEEAYNQRWLPEYKYEELMDLLTK